MLNQEETTASDQTGMEKTPKHIAIVGGGLAGNSLLHEAMSHLDVIIVDGGMIKEIPVQLPPKLLNIPVLSPPISGQESRRQRRKKERKKRKP